VGGGGTQLTVDEGAVSRTQKAIQRRERGGPLISRSEKSEQKKTRTKKKKRLATSDKERATKSPDRENLESQAKIKEEVTGRLWKPENNVNQHKQKMSPKKAQCSFRPGILETIKRRNVSRGGLDLKGVEKKTEKQAEFGQTGGRNF